MDFANFVVDWWKACSLVYNFPAETAVAHKILPVATALSCNETRGLFSETPILLFSGFHHFNHVAALSDCCLSMAGCCFSVVVHTVSRQLAFVECSNFRSSLCRQTMISPTNSWIMSKVFPNSRCLFRVNYVLYMVYCMRKWLGLWKCSRCALCWMIEVLSASVYPKINV